MAATTTKARPFWIVETPQQKADEARHKFEAARRALKAAELCLSRSRVHFAAQMAIHSARRP